MISVWALSLLATVVTMPADSVSLTQLMPEK